MSRLTPLLIAAVLVSFTNLAASHFKKPSVVKGSTLVSDIDYWKKVVADRPTYRDAYLVLSQLSRAQGNSAAAQRYASIAQSISTEDRSTRILGVTVEKVK